MTSKSFNKLSNSFTHLYYPEHHLKSSHYLSSENLQPPPSAHPYPQTHLTQNSSPTRTPSHLTYSPSPLFPRLPLFPQQRPELPACGAQLSPRRSISAAQKPRLIDRASASRDKSAGRPADKVIRRAQCAPRNAASVIAGARACGHYEPRDRCGFSSVKSRAADRAAR